MGQEDTIVPTEAYHGRKRFTLICSYCYKGFGYSNGWIKQMLDSPLYDDLLPEKEWKLACPKCAEEEEEK